MNFSNGLLLSNKKIKAIENPEIELLSQSYIEYKSNISLKGISFTLSIIDIVDFIVKALIDYSLQFINQHSIIHIS